MRKKAKRRGVTESIEELARLRGCRWRRHRAVSAFHFAQKTLEMSASKSVGFKKNRQIVMKALTHLFTLNVLKHKGAFLHDEKLWKDKRQ